MHQIGLEYDLQEWFDFKIPKTKIPTNYIENCLQSIEKFNINPNSKVYWMGKTPKITTIKKQKKGTTFYQQELHFFNSNNDFKIILDQKTAEWFLKILNEIDLNSYKTTTLQNLKNSYEAQLEHFELFWYSKSMEMMKLNGLIVL